MDIWHDDEGIWLQLGSHTHGPFASEEEAEKAFDDAGGNQPELTAAHDWRRYQHAEGGYHD